MRGGARAGAGAPKKAVKRDQMINVKLTKEELITLDITAEFVGMKRSEFIRYCIDEELERQAEKNNL